MDNEVYTFVQCAHDGHTVEQRVFNRSEADRHFKRLVEATGTNTVFFVAYYAVSIGGLVNSYHDDQS